MPTDSDYLSTTSPTSTPKDNIPFRFLDLAPELRSKVLSLAARRDGRATLKRYSRGILSSTDAIGLVSKQLREEYLGVLYQHAQVTLAYVVDFDFRHVVTYFNKLDAAEVRALAKKSPNISKSQGPSEKKIFYLADLNASRVPVFSPFIPHPRRPLHTRTCCFFTTAAAPSSISATRPFKPPELKVFLDFTPRCDWRSTFLLRWLKRMESPDKIGTDAKIVYEAADAEGLVRWEGADTWAGEVFGGAVDGGAGRGGYGDGAAACGG